MQRRKRKLTGSRVLITGAGRGIGATTAGLLAERGAAVWVTDIDAEMAQSVSDRLPGATAARLDVRDRDSWQEVLAKMNAQDAPPDILINNAGVMPIGPFLEQPPEIAEFTIDVNLRGPLNGVAVVLPGMLQRRRGHIITVSSMAAKVPVPGLVTYNASKFGAFGLMESLRQEFRDSGVKFSSILPTAVNTELTAGIRLGWGLPTVEPDAVADTILARIDRPRPVSSVPGWLSEGWDLVGALVPGPIERVARQIVADRRVLTNLDTLARDPYEGRLRRQAAPARQDAKRPSAP